MLSPYGVLQASNAWALYLATTKDDITPLLASHQRDGILEGTKNAHLVVDGSKEPLSGIISYISAPVATFN
jgi:hypothetical protein